MAETVLIVDDEDSVRRTMSEWMAGRGVTVRAAADAEAALRIASAEPIDLAILDWNLGSGGDGLQLLEDLGEFQPDVVAILVTGYAAQATPLDALRRGVRDYLDKNHDLTRETFLAAVTKQLAALAPAKRQRQLQKQLQSFRDAVARAVPLVRDTQAWNQRPLPATVQTVLQFAITGTGAQDAAFVIAQGETLQAFDATGTPLAVPTAPFGRTLAANVISSGHLQQLANFTNDRVLKLFAFETQHAYLVAVPRAMGEGTHGVLEVFGDGPFDERQRAVAEVAADLGAELLRNAMAQGQSHRLLNDALAGALAAGDAVSQVLSDPPAPQSALVTDLVQAIHHLADRHGEPALRHALDSVRRVTALLDTATA
jgi:two-component system, NtrC family, nitrogen regulation response regulator NtrX